MPHIRDDTAALLSRVDTANVNATLVRLQRAWHIRCYKCKLKNKQVAQPLQNGVFHEEIGCGKSINLE